MKARKTIQLGTLGNVIAIDWSKVSSLIVRIALYKLFKTWYHKQQIIVFFIYPHKPGKDGTDPKEKDWDAEMTRIKEKEWFANHPQYKDIQHVCGIDRLMDTMISLLAEKLITEIPILVGKMKNKKVEVNRS